MGRVMVPSKYLEGEPHTAMNRRQMVNAAKLSERARTIGGIEARSARRIAEPTRQSCYYQAVLLGERRAPGAGVPYSSAGGWGSWAIAIAQRRGEGGRPVRPGLAEYDSSRVHDERAIRVWWRTNCLSSLKEALRATPLPLCSPSSYFATTGRASSPTALWVRYPVMIAIARSIKGKSMGEVLSR